MLALASADGNAAKALGTLGTFIGENHDQPAERAEKEAEQSAQADVVARLANDAADGRRH
jgi:hypothetical protein